MTVEGKNAKQLKAIDALKRAFPKQDIKIIISPAFRPDQQNVEISKKQSEQDELLKFVIDQSRSFLENICKRPRRVKILDILKDNPNVSAAQIREIFNYPSGEPGQDTISVGRLNEDLNFLFSLGYVEKKNVRPATFCLAPQTEMIREIATVGKEILIRHSAEKIKKLETDLKKLSGKT